MTRDDIIKLAREAGMPMAWISDSGVLRFSELKRFAALVAQREREACAKVCDEQAKSPALAPLEKYRADFIAAAIRERN